MANEQSKRPGERQGERQPSSATPSTATQSTGMERAGGGEGEPPEVQSDGSIPDGSIEAHCIPERRKSA